MQKLLLVLLFLPIICFANSGVGLEFPQQKFPQGSLQKADLFMDEESFLKLESYKLVGTKIEETIYFVELSPFERKDRNSYKASATVLFLKVPSNQSGFVETSKGKLEFKWGAIEVVPTEGSDKFLFGSFEIPQRKNIVVIFLVVLVISVMTYLGLKFNQRRMKAKATTKELDLIRNEIRAASDYESIVEVWKKKRHILKMFPDLHQAFSRLEAELFKVQFKPFVSESERIAVVYAYRSFLDEIKGDFGGV